MKCPFCKADNDKVVDSRASDEGMSIRRRRECLACLRRYTTYERVEDTPLRVIKKDGRRVPFERSKILEGLRKACEKRPISTEQLDRVVDDIEVEIYRKYDREVPSKDIGQLVMERLRALDKVAYVRFASVYREFKDVSEFVAELKPMLSSDQKKEIP
ncbi:MAG: transcriptional repressor NrdR [Planctomycetes bacterium]|nr:transcriptional repressor NrdR [Planctomycetota bacterium]